MSARPPIARSELTILGAGVAVSVALTVITGLLGRRLDRIPKRDEDIYPYQARQPHRRGERSAWVLYVLHQLFQWGCVYWAQTRPRKYTATVHPVNVVALVGNAVFAVLHLIQTHLWYDGLARRISVWASQSSVILLLCLALLIENPRRGMIFGKPLPFPRRVIEFVRKYHGYYMSWATTFTFWYHPMEGNQGHLSGLIYMFALMMQGSLMFTRAHINPWWTTLLEVAVLPHGVLVALMRHPRNWTMFAFGFIAVFLGSQMQGLGLRLWTQLAIAAGSLAGAALGYRQRGVRAAVEEPLRIPFIEYAVAGVLAGAIGGRQWLDDRLAARRNGHP